MATRILFKLKFGEDLRRWTYEGSAEDLSWGRLLAKLLELYGLDGADAVLSVTYKDADGDVVTLGCQSDVVELLRQGLEFVCLTISASGKDSGSKQRAKDEKERARQESREEKEERRGKAKVSKERPDNKASTDEEPTSKWRACRLDRWIGKLQSELESAVLPDGELRLVKVVRMLEKVEDNLDPAGREKILELLSAKVQESPSLRSKMLRRAPEASFAEALFLQTPELVAHAGVTCDGCNMQPLVGKRFKSLSRIDFDLCEGCKAKQDKPWSKDAFMCIDRPCLWREFEGVALFPQPSSPMPGAAGPCGRGGAWYMPGGRGAGGRFGRGRGGHCGGGWQGFPGWGSQPGLKREAGGSSKLEARFVADVNIFDGTQVSPDQCFTKIWRLRNSGSAGWPEGCSLLCVGGDDIGAAAATPLQLAAGGLPAGSEVDVAVECRAPAEAGRYVSYFRLQEPGGARFGQRVWCMVQVVPAGTEPAQTVLMAMMLGEAAEAGWSPAHAEVEAAAKDDTDDSQSGSLSAAAAADQTAGGGTPIAAAMAADGKTGPAAAAADAGKTGGPAAAAADAGKSGGPAAAAADASKTGGPAAAAADASKTGGPAAAAADAGKTGGPAAAAADAGKTGGPAAAAADASKTGGPAAAAADAGKTGPAAVDATAVSEQEEQLRMAMDELVDMGFQDVEVNKSILSKFGSDISKAVAELLSSSNARADYSPAGQAASAEGLATALAASAAAASELMEEWGLLSADDLGEHGAK